MASPALPPDQSLRKYTKDKRLVVLSVAENGLRIGAGDATDYPTFEHTDFTNGVYLFTENLVVMSDVRAPYGLTAATWSLIGPSGGVKLDASGVQGKAGTTSNPDGEAGGRGGNLGLYVQDLDDSAAKSFTLLARGGAGGDVYKAKAKVGGGGDGGVVTSILQPTYLRVRNSVRECLARSEFRDRKDRDTVVPRTHSLYFATRDLLDAGLGLSTNDNARVFDGLRAEVDKIKGGKESTIRDLLRAANAAEEALSSLIRDQWHATAPNPDQVLGGSPGYGSNVEVDEGKKGKAGQLSPTFLGADSPNSNLAEARLPFAHPEQCGMLLERANIFFYMGSPTLRERARSMYQRLIERLRFIPNLKSSDPLYQAYEKSEIMSSSWKEDLDRIRQSASEQLVHLNSGRTDYYGHSTRWAPRASYNFYKTLLDYALRDFQSFEDAYIKYCAALKDQDDLTENIKLVYGHISRMMASLEKDVEDLWRGSQDLNGKISSMTLVVETAQKELTNAYEAEKSRIQNAFGLSIPGVINAFTMIAFSPTKGMIGVQAGELLYNGFTSIPTTDGRTVTKDYLVSRFNQGEATISNISLELREAIDGTYKLDEAFRSRLLLEKEQILSQLDSFSSKALGGIDDADARKSLKEKFDAYINAVTKRNDLILQYNIKVKLLQKKSVDRTEYENKQKELENKQIKRQNPNLPAITAYVGAIYQSSRLRVMKFLDILLRSLKFRMLDSRSIVAFAFGTENPRLDVPLSLTSTVLSMARGNIVDDFSNGVERWGSEPIHFPSIFDHRPGQYVRGRRYYLKDAYRKQLTKSYSVAVTISPVYRDTKPAGDFGGCCNVRIYRARFGFTGLKTASQVKDGEDVRVQVKLTHSGDESIINSSNAEINFEHDPISTTFSFYLRKDGSMTIEDDGNIAHPDINNTTTSYAAPGPFTEWTIDLEHTEFDKLDFSGVTEAYFDFCGTHHAFP